MKKFDLIIIGGGAAGFASAIKADELSTKTLMVNSELPIGGTCVNVGCVPTKFLLEVAKDYYRARNSRFSSLSTSSRTNYIARATKIPSRRRNRDNYQSKDKKVRDKK